MNYNLSNKQIQQVIACIESSKRLLSLMEIQQQYDLEVQDAYFIKRKLELKNKIENEKNNYIDERNYAIDKTSIGE